MAAQGGSFFGRLYQYFEVLPSPLWPRLFYSACLRREYRTNIENIFNFIAVASSRVEYASTVQESLGGIFFLISDDKSLMNFRRIFLDKKSSIPSCLLKVCNRRLS